MRSKATGGFEPFLLGTVCIIIKRCVWKSMCQFLTIIIWMCYRNNRSAPSIIYQYKSVKTTVLADTNEVLTEQNRLDKNWTPQCSALCWGYLPLKSNNQCEMWLVIQRRAHCHSQHSRSAVVPLLAPSRCFSLLTTTMESFTRYS